MPQGYYLTTRNVIWVTSGVLTTFVCFSSMDLPQSYIGLLGNSSWQDRFYLPAHVRHKGEQHKQDSRGDRAAGLASGKVKTAGADRHDHQTHTSPRSQPGPNPGDAGQQQTHRAERFGYPDKKAKPGCKLCVHNLNQIGGWEDHNPTMKQKLSRQQYLKNPESNIHQLSPFWLKYLLNLVRFLLFPFSLQNVLTWLLPNRLSIKTVGCSGCGARRCAGRTAA